MRAARTTPSFAMCWVSTSGNRRRRVAVTQTSSVVKWKRHERSDKQLCVIHTATTMIVAIAATEAMKKRRMVRMKRETEMMRARAMYEEDGKEGRGDRKNSEGWGHLQLTFPWITVARTAE